MCGLETCVTTDEIYILYKSVMNISTNRTGLRTRLIFMQIALNALKQALSAICKNPNGLLELPLVDLSLPERQPLANQFANKNLGISAEVKILFFCFQGVQQRFELPTLA